MTAGDPAGQVALYFLRDADPRPAWRSDIATYFEEARAP